MGRDVLAAVLLAATYGHVLFRDKKGRRWCWRRDEAGEMALVGLTKDTPSFRERELAGIRIDNFTEQD